MNQVDKSKSTVLIYCDMPPDHCLIVETDAFIAQLREVIDLLERHKGVFNTTTVTLGPGGLILGKGVAETLDEIDALHTKGPTQ